MRIIGEVLFIGGFIIGCTDGAWFPWINFFAVLMAAIGGMLITQYYNLRGEGK